ncbi:MAG: universal stress protein [Rhodobacteraceae bacterium]|nr:universal stress protein [Paracoccaceae bacterium]
MYKNILVPIALDHDNASTNSLEVAHRLLAKGGSITLLHVVENIPAYVAQYLPEGQAKKNRQIATDALSAIAGKDEKAVIVSGHAGTTITEYAEKNGADLIVIASHRPGLQDYFLGSTAARVVRHAPCAVHVLR